MTEAAVCGVCQRPRLRVDSPPDAVYASGLADDRFDLEEAPPGRESEFYRFVRARYDIVERLAATQ